MEDFRHLPHDDEKNPRLPGHVTPRAYDIVLMPNLQDWSFDGYIAIHVDVLDPTRVIQLHALELAFHRVVISPGHLTSRRTLPVTQASLDRPEQRDCKWKVNETTQRAMIASDVEIPAGKYTLEIQFTGELNSMSPFTWVFADTSLPVSYIISVPSPPYQYYRISPPHPHITHIILFVSMFSFHSFSQTCWFLS